MVKTEEAAEFPVFLYNGDQKINVGNIQIHPALDFHQFRKTLNQMIGISYNNLTIYLIDKLPEKRRILITSKVDFSVIVQQKNACLVVLLKRSKRDRRKKSGNNLGVELTPADLFDICSYRHEIESQMAESGNRTEIWVKELQNSYCDYSHVNEEFPSVTEAYSEAVERSEMRALCVDCVKADRRGWKPVFHLCVYDDVVEGCFRSRAGPISRPP